jgi:hypothetical protein
MARRREMRWPLLSLIPRPYGLAVAPHLEGWPVHRSGGSGGWTS